MRADDGLLVPAPDEPVIELDGASRTSRSDPRHPMQAGWRFLQNKGAVSSEPRSRCQPDVVDMVIPGRMFAEAGDLDPRAERIPQENLEKSTHGPAKSRRPRLSTVGQASSAGSGVSKAIWTQTAVGSPGLSETRQT